MKIIYLLHGIVLASSIFCSCSAPVQSDELPLDSIAIAQADNTIYLEMREKMLSLKPHDLGITSIREDQIFGVVVDTHLGDSIETVIALQSGDVSVYYDTGLLYLGGFNVAKTKDAGQNLLEKSEKLLQFSTKSSSTELPNPGFINYYMLTPSGLQSLTINMAELTQENPTWLELNRVSKSVVFAFEDKRYN